MGQIINLLKENELLLFRLERAGIKSIQTAIDYLQIYTTYESLNYVKSKTERKERTAERLGVSKRTVDTAINICNSGIGDTKRPIS